MRSDAGHLALIQHDLKLAVEARDLLHTLLSGSAPDARDHRVANLVEAGLAEADDGYVRLNGDGEWMTQRSLEDYVRLWGSRPNVLQIFRAIDAGRVTVDEAQALLAAERTRRHPTFLRRQAAFPDDRIHIPAEKPRTGLGVRHPHVTDDKCT